MDLSRSLEGVARFLLRWPSDDLRVYVHPAAENTAFRSIVVIELLWNGIRIVSSGASSILYEAFAKALGELGEELICEDFDLPQRSGFAGGLFPSQAIIRAKSELLERDAFFFHYRNRLPFKSYIELETVNGIDEVKATRKLLAFEMASADREFSSFLVTDSECASGRNGCLLFGTAAHPDPQLAISKASEEYACIYLNHRRQPDRCRWLSENREHIPRLVDMHHAASRDPRNIVRFTELCSVWNGHGRAAAPRPPASGEWEVEKLPSPLRLISYYRVRRTGLIEIEFGVPEAETDPSERPLYHPFW